jgi:sialate O-acetylesterase
MIQPLAPYGIAGVIWYQGEANTGRPTEYRKLFPTMIQAWRDAFGRGDFPFYYVQLANFRPRQRDPVDSNWAALREAQRMTLAFPNTGMAVTVDIGDEADIHPRNKLDVGRRLALIALARTYGREAVVYAGPMYRAMQIDGDRIRLTFDHAQGLRTSDGAGPAAFAIAEADRKFAWAKAVIEGDTVVLHHPEILRPVAVRYGWEENPPVNLYNAAGLPASPFRTDDW